MNASPIKLIEQLFIRWSGVAPISVIPLAQSGSYRTYYRISCSEGSILGVHNTDTRENETFLYLNEQLKKAGNKVPEVIIADLDHHVYLEQDLGDLTLFEHLSVLRKNSCTDKDLLPVYKNVIDAMPGLQVHAAQSIDYSRCYPRAEFDIQSMMWDMNYFKYCLLKPLKIDFFEQDLEDDFNRIVHWLIQAERASFMFRDFQSRNIMITPDKDYYFIDFQGGRKGPLQYDLASLLFEAKTHLSDSLREELLHYYMGVYAKNFKWFKQEEFMRYYYGFVYLRLMQAMGAYGFRGYIEHKPVFLQSLPYAVKNLKWLMEKHPIPLNLTSLPGVFNKLIDLPQIQNFDMPGSEHFTITINSFSYKSGIPQDHSGNGGGFVFDCRALENPGRYEQYKDLNGMDQEVIDFLDPRSDVKHFMAQAFDLVFQAADVYIQRGFTHLMVSFGCTGGQHRSVYMAEHMAQALKDNKPAHIVVIHHELGKKKKET